MFERGIAVVAITQCGVQTALKIQKALDLAQLQSTVYAPKKYSQNGTVTLDKKIGDFTKDVYSKVDAIVAVMATGITIRSVAPLLESKLYDPAVVGADTTGKFVVSLLSGHLGGANELTRIIAAGINATPVITTATDVMGKQSVEDLAKSLHLKIHNPESLVAVNSAIVNCDRIVVVLLGDVKLSADEVAGCYEVKVVQNGSEALNTISDCAAGIIITNEPLTPTKANKPYIVLNTRKIIVGLGARKEASKESMVQAIQLALEKISVPLSRVDAIATVDIKRTSQPMLEAVAELGKTLEFLSVDALCTVTYSDLSPDSAMVQEKIGIGGVCERAALKVAGTNSKLILKKTILNGVTVAVAEGE